MSPSPVQAGRQRGFVVAIGGGEDKIFDLNILRQLVDVAGADRATVAVIPTASELEDTGDKYCDIFLKLGVRSAFSLPLDRREDAQQARYLERLQTANTIFITGGNQLRLSTILGGTPIAQAIRKLNAQGVHIAGTSAGAAIIPEHMIVGGGSGALPTQDGVNLAPGLGLTNALLIDQHFNERNRLGRLLSALSYNAFLIGVGLDEDTAIFLDPEDSFEVIGSGSVTVLDASELSHSSMASAAAGESISMLDLRMHVLSDGGHYNIKTRKAMAPK